MKKSWPTSGSSLSAAWHDGSDALTPDGNLTLIDDIGSSTKAGKQFITLESKNGITAAIPRRT